MDSKVCTSKRQIWITCADQSYRVLSKDRRFGQTCEAFAVCVTRMFQAFERRMSSIEVNHCQTQGIISSNWISIDSNCDVLQVADPLSQY